MKKRNTIARSCRLLITAIALAYGIHHFLNRGNPNISNNEHLKSTSINTKKNSSTSSNTYQANKAITAPTMNYKDPISVDTQANPQYAIIWLHGLGADGSDFVPVVPELKVDDIGIRFIFPHAPIRSVTVNNGYAMPAWYDIKGADLADKEDLPGMTESLNYLNELIEEVIASGIKSENIMLAGFSQGGAVASYTFIRSKHKLAGCMALSTYVPFMANSKNEQNQANLDSPIFWGHGSQDMVVPQALGKTSTDHLTALGYNVEWHSYPMEHSVNMDEIKDIGNWIRTSFKN